MVPGQPEASLKRRAIESTLWTFGGYGVQQAIRFGSNVVLTYLLFPELFGIMAMVNVFIQGLHMFTDLGEGANVVQSKRGEDIDFLHTLWTFGILRNLVIWAGACTLAWPVAQFYGEPLLMYVLPVAGFTSVIGSFGNAGTTLWLRRVQLYKTTIMGITCQVAAAVTMIIWAYYSRSIWALVAGAYAQTITHVILSYVAFKLPAMRFRWDAEAWREIFHFGKWIFMSSVLGFLANRLDYLFIGREGLGTLGIYHLANQIVFVFIRSVYITSARVLFPVYARLAERGQASLTRNVVRVRAGILGVIGPCLCLLVVLGPELVQIVYDEQFHDAGWMLQVLAAGAIVLVINYTVDSVTLAKGDSYRYMIVRGSKSFILFFAMYFGVRWYGDMGLVWGVALAELINYPIVSWAVRRHGVWMPKFDFLVVVIAAVMIAIGFLLKPYLLVVVEPMIESLLEWKRTVRP